MTLKLAGAVFMAILLLPGGPRVCAQKNVSDASANLAAATRQDPNNVVQFLSHSISWRRQIGLEEKLVSNPAEARFAQEDQRISDQIVRLAFEYARAAAKQLAIPSANPVPGAQTQGDAPAQYQRLAQAMQRVEQQLQETQQEVQGLRDKLSRAPAAKRSALQAQVDETQSEVELLQARKDALQNLTEFAASGGDTATPGLSAQIEALARSVPASLSRGTPASQEPADQTSAANSLPSNPTDAAGIWELARDLIRLYGKLRVLNGQLAAAQALEAQLDRLRTPLVSDIRSLIHQGDQLANEADTSGAAELKQQKQQLDALTMQFKQVSALMLPLGKIGVLLANYQGAQRNWKQSVHDEIRDDLRQLALKIAVLIVLIAIALGLGDLWRRATFKYVHDGRRRYQFLLLRRIVIWITISVILVLAFATQIGSAVTFAGLLTAGVAVALQNVIVSIVGYFFLIGKYGLRVGDRVQVAGVTGEVVEIGLVRMHLMELGGPGENQPTGRVVAFSNSIVFQPASGLFKQIPGTNFVWHELKLTLASESDYHQARERITKAVDSVLQKHQPDIDAQRRLMEQNLSPVANADMTAKVRLRYTSQGIEATIRFPVEIGKASEMDDHIMRAVLEEANNEPKLRVVSAEMPLAQAGK